MTTLADLTTFRIGGPIAEFAPVSTEGDFIEAVRSADAAGIPVLVIGGGSNLLGADSGFAGRVVQDQRRGITLREASACGGADVEVVAGHPWDDVVAVAGERGWIGIEALAGIPGSTGATPVQNVGAYGQDISATLTRVRVWDRVENRVRTLTRSELGFGYRHSILKSTQLPGSPTPRLVVLDVSFQFLLGDLGAPVAYPELARALGVEVGQRAPTSAVREAVLGLRGRKGMVLDASDHDTWSAGSFFTNPVVSADTPLPDGVPNYPEGDRVKVSAAALLERSGFTKGFGLPGPAALSTKHVLALTNRGTATSAQVRELAERVAAEVHRQWAITLHPEPLLLPE